MTLPDPDSPAQATDSPAGPGSPEAIDPSNVIVVSEGEDSGDVEGDDAQSLTDLIEQPAKVMRIGSMIKQLLDEVRSAPLDDASRAQLAQIHARSIAELEDGLAPELVEELNRLTLPFDGDSTPSDAELRIAQAQLVGWLEGLFHGIQTAMFAQQMAARAQFEELRRRAALGSGMDGDGSGQLHPGQGAPSGPYL